MLFIKKIKLFAAVTAVLALTLCFPSLVFAVKTEGSITLNCPIQGQTFYIYRIADIDSKGYHLTEEMSKYSVDLTVSTAADTLSAYVKRDSISPLNTLISTADKKVVFTNLSDGVYLITGDRLVTNGKYITIKAALISVPRYIDAKDQRQVTAECKYEVNTDNKKPFDVSVIKVWSSDSGQARPKSVTVQLLRNGSVYDIAILNSSNSWKYVWKNLSREYEWKVVEKEVPKGYKVKVESDGALSFTITNRGNETKTTTVPKTTGYSTTTNPHSSTPSYSTSTTPTNPHITYTYPSQTNPTPTNPNEETPPPDIPQTGQLWWPVTWLLIGGCLLVIIGVCIKRTS